MRRVREAVTKAGGKLAGDNVYERGLTVDAWIVADEAARLSNDLIAVLRPMRARRPEARFAMLSTAWSRTDPFCMAWDSDDPSWIRLKATADTVHYDPEFLEKERRALGEDGFKREYLGIPLGGQASPFTWELYEGATQIHVSLVPPGPAFGPPAKERAVSVQNPFQRLLTNRRFPMMFNPKDPKTWGCFRPLIIAHDVGRSRDRSTAIIGGLAAFDPNLIGIQEAHELPQRSLWKCACQCARNDRPPL